MVCDFGFAPGSINLLATSGAKAWRSIQHHDAIVGADNVVPWWKSPTSIRMKDSLGKAGATSFTHGEENTGGADKKEEGGSGGGCFPGFARIYAKGRGPLRIDELEAGDMVLCGEAGQASLSFSPFLGHLHFEPDVLEDYIAIETNMDSKVGSPLLISDVHLIFAADSQESPAIAVRAGDLRKGNWLCRASSEGDLQRAQITNVSNMRGLQGRYCPLTQAGTIVVEGSLCSCYVNPFIDNAPAWLRGLAANQELVHSILLPVRIMSSFGWKLRDGQNAFEEKKDDRGIHPYLRSLMSLPAVGTVI
mmetsp:Transcript_100276/g.158064  ORF Transcript_100276/g.158064 Transcript_100276/m.158064 type:complete len:305 (+) Transcript_100276:108-1022(+)